MISTSSNVTPLHVQIPQGKKTEDEACRRKWRECAGEVRAG